MYPLLSAKQREIFDEGCEAFRNNLDPSDCPYTYSDLEKRCMWLAAYWDTRNESEKQAKSNGSKRPKSRTR